MNMLIALELYTRAMEINPENIRVASSLINSLLWKGDGKQLYRFVILPCTIILITDRFGKARGWLYT